MSVIKKTVKDTLEQHIRDAANHELIDNKILVEIEMLQSGDRSIWNAPDHNRRENVHGFFQYPAMMVPIVQQYLIQSVISNRPDIKRVIDPFLGAATSMVAAMRSGLECYGQDINPLAILLSKVKTGPYYFTAFGKAADRVIFRAKKSKSTRVLKGIPNVKKWFKSDVALELSKLVRAIKKENSIYARRFLWVTLAETIRLTSNDRTSTYKLHARPLHEIDKRHLSPIEVFGALIVTNIQDIKQHATALSSLKLLRNGLYPKEISITLGDSAFSINSPTTRPKEKKFDLLVSSPPYGDNKTTIPYGQHAYLPLLWIDFNDIDQNVTRDWLKSASEIDSSSLGGRIKKFEVSEIDLLFDKTPTLEKTILLFHGTHKRKIKKVVNFIMDFDKALTHICDSLNNNAYLIWTIGNRNVGNNVIRNDKILIELLATRQIRLIKSLSRKILNKRMARRNSSSETMTKEYILIFRKSSS